MTAHVGIVACSAEGAALCYRTICIEAQQRLGEHMHPEVSMHTHPLGRYMEFIRAGDWRSVASLMLSSADKLAAAGADFLVCPDNTIHQAFPFLENSPLPWLHIADPVAAEARAGGFSRLAVLGTKYLMSGPVYREKLEEHGLRGAVAPVGGGCPAGIWLAGGTGGDRPGLGPSGAGTQVRAVAPGQPRGASAGGGDLVGQP